MIRCETIHETFMREFGLDKPLWQQFFIYVGQLAQGNLGTSFAQYPAPVNTLVGNALPWSIVIQLPAIVIGWIVGNVLGAIAAFKGGWFRPRRLPRLAVPVQPAVLLPGDPAAVRRRRARSASCRSAAPTRSVCRRSCRSPSSGDAITYFWLPFWSLVLVFIGGQAVGMRSMAIYELGSDYVNYGRGLGLRDSTIVRYIFRNAMLPQITGLALSIGGMIGGALITELVFSYPGLGTLLFNAIEPERLSGDPVDHLVDHAGRARRQLLRRDRVRLHRSADPGRSEWRSLMKVVRAHSAVLGRRVADRVDRS